jgi:putative transposase
MPKDELNLTNGMEVSFRGDVYQIRSSLSLTSFLVKHPVSGEEKVADLKDISPVNTVNDAQQESQSAVGVRLSSEQWQQAKRRESIIRPLAELMTVPTVKATQAAKELNLSVRHVYTLISRYRDSGGLLTSLVPTAPKGGRGNSRLSPVVEEIITRTIDEVYLTKQKLQASDVIFEIIKRCCAASLKPPTPNTIRSRINKLPIREKILRRQGAKSLRKLNPVSASFPEAIYPLQVLQIDHTPVDLIIVDEVTRQPIGRPYLTVAIDIYSRCITGFCLTLEAPGAVSVGLCLAHSILDKESWMSDRKIDGEWPIWGKPDCIHVDNAAEFHSEALRRGCEQHGIQINYRPMGHPHYGGAVERVIGTLMQHVHKLPGTTFSNVQERGEYDSDGKAILTLRELEHWLAVVITGHYHNKVHASLHEPPIERYKAGILGRDGIPGRGVPPLLQNKKDFLIDFLPIEKRTLQRHGFRLDHIAYYSNALQPWIASRRPGQKYIIRRDPRDLSRIFVLHPERDEYLEIPYRTLSRPSITLWEHRSSLKRLRDDGVKRVDETAIFRAIDKMRQITEQAAQKSRAARRKRARLVNAPNTTAATTPLEDLFAKPFPEPVTVPQLPQRFDDIEEW